MSKTNRGTDLGEIMTDEKKPKTAKVAMSTLIDSHIDGIRRAIGNQEQLPIQARSDMSRAFAYLLRASRRIKAMEDEQAKAKAKEKPAEASTDE